MFKIVLFDLDGTLIDSSDDICDSVNYALNLHGCLEESKDAIMCHVGVGAAYLIEKLLPKEDSGFVKKVLETYLEYYGEHSVEKTKLYEGVLGYLKGADRPLGLITNKPRLVGEQVLEKLGLGQYFKWHIFGDTYPVLKPDPCALLKIIEEAGVAKEDVLYVGDTGVDLKFAENAGVKSCLFKSGFGGIVTFTEVKATYEITCIEELKRIVTS